MGPDFEEDGMVYESFNNREKDYSSENDDEDDVDDNEEDDDRESSHGSTSSGSVYRGGLVNLDELPINATEEYPELFDLDVLPPAILDHDQRSDTGNSDAFSYEACKGSIVG
jgi:hypothetical protein